MGGEGRGRKSLPQVAFVSDRLALTGSTLGNAEAFESKFSQIP